MSDRGYLTASRSGAVPHGEVFRRGVERRLGIQEPPAWERKQWQRSESREAFEDMLKAEREEFRRRAREVRAARGPAPAFGRYRRAARLLARRLDYARSLYELSKAVYDYHSDVEYPSLPPSSEYMPATWQAICGGYTGIKSWSGIFGNAGTCGDVWTDMSGGTFDPSAPAYPGYLTKFITHVRFHESLGGTPPQYRNIGAWKYIGPSQNPAPEPQLPAKKSPPPVVGEEFGDLAWQDPGKIPDFAEPKPMPWWLARLREAMKIDFGGQTAFEPALRAGRIAQGAGQRARTNARLRTRGKRLNVGVRPHRLARPGRKVKEFKVRFTILNQLVGVGGKVVSFKRWLGNATEAFDLIEVMYDALPKSCKPNPKRLPPAVAKRLGRAYAAVPFSQKAVAVYNCIDEINWAEFQRGFIANQLEDFFYGVIGQHASLAGRAQFEIGGMANFGKPEELTDFIDRTTGLPINDFIGNWLDYDPWRF